MVSNDPRKFKKGKTQGRQLHSNRVAKKACGEEKFKPDRTDGKQSLAKECKRRNRNKGGLFRKK